VNVLSTLDEYFAARSGYSYEPRYVAVDIAGGASLPRRYVDEGRVSPWCQRAAVASGAPLLIGALPHESICAQAPVRCGRYD